MDNKVFSVAGETKEQLNLALQSALLDAYGNDETIKGWCFDEEKGIVLFKYSHDKCNDFMSPMDANGLTEMLWKWLQDSKQAEEFKITESWDKDIDHDGSNSRGWRLYTEDWGVIGKFSHGSYLAFVPRYNWYGK